MEADGNQATELAERHLGPLLLLGMLAAPALSVWLFLRKGYPRSLRTAAFTFAGVMTAIGLLAAPRF
jgi:hypothetical protein